MANDEIKELIGRYATGSLTAAEQKRLFDAAIDDQDLFNEIAQEQDIKQLLAEPGARDRLIHALQPPPRKTAWMFGLAATAALTVVIGVVLMRPAPKPAEVAVAKNVQPSANTAVSQTPPVEAAPPAKAPPPVALADKPRSAPSPVASPQPAVKQKAAEVSEPSRDASPPREASKDTDQLEKTQKKAENKPENKPENKVEDRKEADQVAVAAAAPVVAPPTPAPAPAATSARAGSAIQSPLQQLRMKTSPSGPRQQQQAQDTTQQKNGVAGGGVSALASPPGFGFHYSVETKGHLILIPSADGFLTAKSNNVVLFARKRVAAGILIDLALPDGAASVSVSFAASTLPPSMPSPTVRTEPEGTVQGSTRLAVEIKINQQ